MNTLVLALLATSLAVSVAVTNDSAEISAELATQMARECVRLAAAPEVRPVSGQCANCRGTGKVGDGKISMTCRACNGTGKEPVSVLVKPPKPCATGRCTL